MSSIPTKQIDGDVAVGRNVSMGGSGTVRGSMTVGHNLTVGGWLEAKNIKGPNKGLFKTAAQLREAYPNPHEGWWALVTVEGSASSDHLGQLYVADGGTWVAQVDSNGNPLLKGNPTVDSTEYMEAVEDMKADLEAVKVDVNQNKEDIRSLHSAQTDIDTRIGSRTGSAVGDSSVWGELKRLGSIVTDLGIVSEISDDFADIFQPGYYIYQNGDNEYGVGEAVKGILIVSAVSYPGGIGQTQVKIELGKTYRRDFDTDERVWNVSIRRTTGFEPFYTTIATVTINLIVAVAIVLLNLYLAAGGQLLDSVACFVNTLSGCCHFH